MIRDDLIKRFPRATEAFLRRNASDADDPRVRPAVQLQELETPNAKRTHHRSKTKAKDAGDHPRFRVTIALRFSDRRRRDPDGCATTILDALITARRLLDRDSRGDRDE